MRLLLDEMYPGRLARQLRDLGHDVVAVVESPDLIGQPDALIARWAREHGRAVVTENVADYAALPPDADAGLLLVNGRRWPRSTAGIAALATAIAAHLENHSAGDAPRQGSVDWI